MEVKSVAADAVFRTFTACPTDPRTLILDVRDKKHFDKGHIAGAFCIRLPSNGSVLLDYSKNEYDVKWSADCWWNRDVVVYGDAGLKKDHPVVAFLARDKHARSLSIYRDGLEAFAKAYPFLVTTSVRSGVVKRYPSQLDAHLYLGDWEHAEASERHAELGITAVITIHNNPDNLKLHAGRYRHLKVELADVDTADISSHLRPAYDFIEEARAGGRAVLVHCGAGVSRSATLCIAYLMRKNRWNAQKALEFARGRRSLVAPNDGFWRTLCALEAQLGITERSNVDAFAGFHGADAPVAAEIVEPKTRVTFVPAGATSAPAGSKAQTAAPAVAPQAAAPQQAAAAGRDRDRDRDSEGRDGGRRQRSRSRERERDRERDRRWRSRSRERRDRDKERDRERRRSSRSRSRDRDRRRRSRERSRSRERERRRGGEGEGRGGGGGAGSRGGGGGDSGREGAPVVAAAAALQQQQGGDEERVDIGSTSGVVLEVSREGKQLGHLVVEMQRVSQECLFGRMPSCDVQIEHLSASRAHAQLTTDGAGNLFITDLGSAHGTNVDGVWVKAKVPKQLRQGSVLKFGASVRQYKVAQLPKPAARR